MQKARPDPGFHEDIPRGRSSGGLFLDFLLRLLPALAPARRREALLDELQASVSVILFTAAISRTTRSSALS